MSDSKEIDRFSQAVALLKQGIEKVEATLEKVPAPTLMNLRSLEEIPQGARGSIENILWRIYVYGKYPLAKMWSYFDQPLLITNSSNWQFTYYNQTYKPISEKISKLLNVTMMPERKEVEVAVVEECDFFVSMTPGKTLASEIDDHMDCYEYLVVDGWVGNFVRNYIENCSADANTGRPSSAQQNPILSCFASVFAVVRDYQWRIEYERGCQNLASEDLGGDGITDTEKDKTEIEKRESRDVDLSAIKVKDEVVEDDEEREEREACNVDLSDFEKVIKKRYFNPDNWVVNEEDLGPFTVSRRVPILIRRRVEEIHNSYIFGNWMAVIALSRCLLEYAINDQGPFYGIEVYLTKNEAVRKGLGNYKNRTRDLGEIIKATAKIKGFESLASSMTAINKAGNKVMHPTPKNNSGKNAIDISSFLYQDKEDARKCLTEIKKIITTLYSENPLPKKPNPPLKPSPK